MLKRYPIALAAALICTAAISQERSLIGIRFGQYLRNVDPNTMVDVFLQGNTSEVQRIAKAHGGQVKMSMRNWTSVRMPAGRIQELNAEPAVRSIECNVTPGEPMNDSMRVKTHIDHVQQGLAPLPRPYNGEGVVIGIVDTGLDLTHPDVNDTVTGTRVLHYWDHHQPFNAQNTPPEFGYGQEWDKAAIDAGQCPVGETDAGGHGTTVAGTAAGNGGLTGQYIGAAPKSDLIIVSTQFNTADWSSTVADGVKYVFDAATDLGRPAVVNLSLGSYLGSHDGLDPAALLIDSMVMAAPGRSVVCAAGNSGCYPKYQLRMEVGADTTFSWIKTNSAPNNAFGGTPVAYIDFWADTADMNNVSYSIGADRVTGGYAYRGRIPFRNVQGTVNTFVEDTLFSLSGNTLAVCSTFASVRGGQYHLEIALIDPDSAAYNWRVMMTGDGRCDAWGNNGFGLSEIVSTDLPTVAQYPAMAHYITPTLDRGIVDSWACSPHVITVANYNNEQVYTDINGNIQNIGGIEGDISPCSSHGLTRTDLQKPDLAAPGDITFSAAPLSIIQQLLNSAGIFKLSADTMHVRAGGTSIASPAVAGAVALYLQKCPYATQDQIIAAINGSAFPDSFTGAVPNNIYGHGKLDAFAPLVATNFEVNVTSTDELFCEGDSSLAGGPAGFADYLWSDGTMDVNAWSQGEPLALTVINDQGCLATSDTLFFNTIPAPGTPVITQDGAILTSTPADAFQWNFNGQPILAANAQSFTVEQTGDYSVTVTGPNGCEATSDPLYVVISGIDAEAPTGFRVWPVPAKGTLFVSVDGAEPLTYDIVSVTGSIVQRGALRPGGTSLIDISGLPAGSYTLRAGEGQRTFVVR